MGDLSIPGDRSIPECAERRYSVSLSTPEVR